MWLFRIIVVVITLGVTRRISRWFYIGSSHALLAVPREGWLSLLTRRHRPTLVMRFIEQGLVLQSCAEEPPPHREHKMSGKIYLCQKKFYLLSITIHHDNTLVHKQFL